MHYMSQKKENSRMPHYQKRQENEYGQPIGFDIATPQAQVPQQDLNGSTVCLRQLTSSNLTQTRLEQLWQVIQTEVDHQCWTYLTYDAPQSLQQLQQFLNSQFNFANAVHYLIELNHHIVGWVAFLNIRPEHQAIEIGNVYFSHAMKRSTAATETIYLLLQEACSLGYRRVEWKCDELNAPSKQAALRYGFQFEGVFRQDRIYKQRNRNTAWFSILDEEWSVLKHAYMAWLHADNFDQEGKQKQRLKDLMVQ